MYKVINSFADAEDNEKVYKVGDIYPTKGKSKERIAYLESKDNLLGVPVIEYVKDKK